MPTELLRPVGKTDWRAWAIRLTPALIGTFILLFFLDCAWPGLFVGFDNDDVMNLHFAWRPPLHTFLLSNLVPFTTFYRPMGSLYYRLCYAVFGWRPGLFRLVTYGLMALNIYLIYLLTRRLTNKREIAALAALLYSFHGKLRQLYMSNGTVYDVLAATFTLLTLWYYARLRQTREKLRFWQYALVVALSIAAVNAKEMGAVLPALLLCYELIYHRPASFRWEAWKPWFRRYLLLYLLLFAVAISAAWGKPRQGSPMAPNPLYAPSYTARRFLNNERRVLKNLTFDISFNTTGVVLFYGSLFAFAVISRNKLRGFAACFALIAPLPILFIPSRGFFAMYMPLAGFMIYFASILVGVRDWLWRVVWKRPPLGLNPWEPERVFLFLAVAFLIHMGIDHDPESMLDVEDPSLAYIVQAHEAFMRLNEPLPAKGRILILKCPYPDDSWGPLQMLQILYGDRDLWVERPAMMAVPPTPAQYPDYTRVIDQDGSKLVVLRRYNPPTSKLEYPRR